MGTIVCQECQGIIETFDEEKVTTLYGTCPDCNQ
ncbi:GapA-binding peptide SR1P [Lentibacillus sediminis]|nr:GapA-binding peptide SR1P [Lentibacillus sediminis]